MPIAAPSASPYPNPGTTLRRLVLARDAPAANGDPSTGHLCLFAVDPAEADTYVLKHLRGFECACGATFDAVCELSSWTTEYDKRCLNTFAPWFVGNVDPRRIK